MISIPKFFRNARPLTEREVRALRRAGQRATRGTITWADDAGVILLGDWSREAGAYSVRRAVDQDFSVVAV